MTTGHILIVDDDRHIRSVMRMVLESDGFTIDEAEDGAEALRLVEEVVPDLVFLDLMMPRMNGLEVLRRLRSDPRTAACKVVVVSAMARYGRRAALDAGADEYFEKPFSPLALLDVVERTLASPPR